MCYLMICMNILPCCSWKVLQKLWQFTLVPKIFAGFLVCFLLLLFKPPSTGALWHAAQKGGVYGAEAPVHLFFVSLMLWMSNSNNNNFAPVVKWLIFDVLIRCSCVKCQFCLLIWEGGTGKSVDFNLKIWLIFSSPLFSSQGLAAYGSC